MLRIRKNFEQAGARLYVCSTPIGNLQDCSFRLLETLRSVDIIAAEDTRQVQKLLNRYDIHGPSVTSFHEHNQRVRLQDFVRWWDEGKQIALVSDAGTPAVSDPGAEAVCAAIDRGVPVIPVPGPSAVLAALVASGLPVQPFTFVGFLPRGERETFSLLQSLAGVPGTLVFYEAPHRLTKTLARISQVWPERDVVLAKELTKVHETFISGRPDEVLAYLQEEPPRGEYVVLVGPGPGAPVPGAAPATSEQTWTLADAIGLVQELMAQGHRHADAVRQVAERTGMRKKDLYRATLPEG